jgi:GNAT superfamily N-acetyltransferase
MNELERVEAAALRDAVPRGGGRAEVVGGALCVAHPTVPVMEVNRALTLGGAVDVDAIAAWFEGPHTIATRDVELSHELGRRGYEPARSWMKFEREAAPVPAAETDASVEETLDRDAFAEIVGNPALAAMVGAPGWACFLARLDGQPAACGVLFVDGATAWLGIAFTREQFRRRGAQSALLAARITRAHELGATLLAVETGERLPDRQSSSYENILRAGFREAYLRANWRSPA